MSRTYRSVFPQRAFRDFVEWHQGMMLFHTQARGASRGNVRRSHTGEVFSLSLRFGLLWGGANA